MQALLPLCTAAKVIPAQKWSPSLIKYAKRQNWSQNEQNWSRFENMELIKVGL